MADRFEICFPRFEAAEGGFSNHPDDNGGPTMRGVTLATFRDFYGAGASVADLKRITTAQVARIFRSGYWTACRCDDLPAGIDYLVADMAINAGPGRAIRILQRALGGVVADGVIGPVTLAAARSHPDLSELAFAFTSARLAYYRGLDDWPAFGKGWAARATKSLNLALGDIRTAEAAERLGLDRPAPARAAARPASAPAPLPRLLAALRRAFAGAGRG